MQDDKARYEEPLRYYLVWLTSFTTQVDKAGVCHQHIFSFCLDILGVDSRFTVTTKFPYRIIIGKAKNIAIFDNGLNISLSPNGSY
ncbi:hypothetical protein [Edwardsiella tarda]